MEKIISRTLLKDEDNFSVEFEVLQEEDLSQCLYKDNNWVDCEMKGVDLEIDNLNEKIANLDDKIDLFTNHADKLDNSIAVASGLLCGLIDSFFVGTFSFEEGMNITNQEMEEKIIGLARKKGWKGITKGERKGQYPLDSAIKFLEDNFKMPSDSLENIFGGSRQHHLRDFAHHHSIIGLFFSILTQITGKAYGTDTNGMFISVEVPKEMIGKDINKKFAIAITDWALHLASDMHGSNKFAGKGAGIPGPILSLLKAISALPIFGTKPHIPGEVPKPNKLSMFVAKLFNGTLLAQRDENGKLIPVKMDFRGEKAIGQHLKKQAMPVILNDILVRTFYFIRRLYIELKENKINSWNNVVQLNWRKIIPVYNRTINHMLLVASGTFVAVDLGDAAIRSAIKSGGSWEKFTAELLLRINYPGIGRFVVSLGTEGYMEFRRNKMRTERMAMMSELLQANCIKMFYTQKQMWIAASSAREAIDDLYETAEKSKYLLGKCIIDIDTDYREIEKYSEDINKNNPWIIELLNK